MIKHKDQRVGVFIDVQNMYYSAKNLFNSKVDFGNILETAVAGRKLIRAIAYVVKATGEEQPFFEALNQRGLETKERELQVFESGAKKADWDVGMAVDAIRIGEILDVVVLVSGDGDFVELVDYLKHHGRQVEAIAFGGTTSAKLRATVDDFIDLSEDKDKYLIKMRPHGQTPAAASQPPRPPQTPRAPQPPRMSPSQRQQPRSGNRQPQKRTPPKFKFMK
ncbi:MAG: NYN domain-containing protein [Patescibacteria group bacterium]|jgi:uncharacterized LabA/DUF88 family protein